MLLNICVDKTFMIIFYLYHYHRYSYFCHYIYWYCFIVFCECCFDFVCTVIIMYAKQQQQKSDTILLWRINCPHSALNSGRCVILRAWLVVFLIDDNCNFEIIKSACLGSQFNLFLFFIGHIFAPELLAALGCIIYYVCFFIIIIH